ncbi:MAG: hypothetical protein KGJ80_15650, partial [Chloroflexota bacterium]|nr:hypothetical protein [Chloroflexota bacterium]
SRAVTHHGNDLYREIVLPAAREIFKVTDWDVWMLVVLVNEFGGDWEKLANHLRRERFSAPYRDLAVEGFLNHLRLLRQTLAKHNLSVEDVLGEDAARVLKSEKRKAKRKILEESPPEWEQSPWMIHTPKEQRKAHALRGNWGRFPVSPAQYAEPMAHLFKTSGWYTENQSFALERKLSGFVDRKAARAALPELFALYRAFLTVIIEKMNMVDDSYGVIGDLSSGIFQEYVKLDRVALAMSSADFFQDLTEWLIWEDYGLTYQEQPAFFASLDPEQVPFVEHILRTQWGELRELELDYQAEEALTMLGMLCTQQRLFDKFLDLAKAMGTRHWQRITTMSEMAERHDQPALALAVYETCFGPGMHEKFLREKYVELQKRIERK